MKRLLPDTIAVRTLLVLVIGLTVSHLASVALYRTDREKALSFAEGLHTAEHIATIVQIIEGTSQAERQRIIDLADNPKLQVIWSAERMIEDRSNNSEWLRFLRSALQSRISGGRDMLFRLHRANEVEIETWRNHRQQNREQDKSDDILMVSLQLKDSSWLNFAAPVDTPEPFWSFRLALSMLVMLLAVVAFSALVVRRMTAPLSAFAAAAERIGANVKAPSMPEQGPAEVRQAARAFNEMQARIRRFVEDRTQMLAAIAHDLGTPITRLRLRAEFVEDPEQRMKMHSDLDDMERMVTAALSFARDETTAERDAMVDLRSLLRRVCDEISDLGHDVTLDVGDAPVRHRCRPAALRRALTNLIHNAVKYGAAARVSLFDRDRGVIIRIDDKGPGIAAEFIEEAFRPFRRLEGSRNRETGGTGLGLSVARTIVRAHGGEILLANRPEGGLRVEVSLPPVIASNHKRAAPHLDRDQRKEMRSRVTKLFEKVSVCIVRRGCDRRESGS